MQQAAKVCGKWSKLRPNLVLSRHDGHSEQGGPTETLYVGGMGATHETIDLVRSHTRSENLVSSRTPTAKRIYEVESGDKTSGWPILPPAVSTTAQERKCIHFSQQNDRLTAILYV